MEGNDQLDFLLGQDQSNKKPLALSLILKNSRAIFHEAKYEVRLISAR